MRLADIRDLITRSDPVAWNELGSPLFLDAGTLLNRSGAEVPWRHHSLLVYREDVRLSIAWGLEFENTADGPDYETGWSRNFPDAVLRGFYCDVFWSGTLVDRELMWSVDGGRAYLPAGQSVVENGQTVAEEVTQWALSLARVIDQTRGQASEFESYLKRSGLRITG